MLRTVDRRLALRREPDKSFTLLGSVIVDTKSEVTVTTPGGAVETFARSGVMFVAFGSLNHFARLDPEGLQRAFAGAPLAVFEQALVDAKTPLSATDLKVKLTQAGLAVAGVDQAWNDLRKALERSSDVKVTGAGAARKFSWKGSPETRLGTFIAGTFARASEDLTAGEPSPVNTAQEESTPGTTP